jgi:DNA recombination protein RmuC
MTDILFLFIGLALGGLVTWLILRARISSHKMVEGSRLAELKERFDLQSRGLAEKEREILALHTAIAEKDTDLKHFREKLEQQKEEVQRMQQQLQETFKNLANEIMEEKSKTFSRQNRESLDQILKPFRENLHDLRKKVEETYDKEAQQRFSLKEEVKRLAEMNQKIGEEARALTRALKSESKTQGNWGEMILESILEKSGLQRNREFFVQQSFTNVEGRRLQPDVVVHYPGERSIIIDSKVSLTAYERYVSAMDDAVREAELKAHLESVRQHVKELNVKSYQDLYQLKSLDFVMLFMAVEPAYLLAIQHDPQLWQYAYDRRILLISPTNLIAALKMVDSMWKQEYQNRNVMKIAEQGGRLYDDFVLFYERLSKLGKKLDEAKDAHSETMKKLQDGRGNLVSRVENLKKLGVKAKKQLPGDAVERSFDPAGDNEEETIED